MKKPKPQLDIPPDPRFAAVDADGNERDMSILDKEDVAYDPTQMTVDLTKEEKRRTTALMLAIQAYSHLIIKDGQMYTAIKSAGGKIHPATFQGMIEAAIGFDLFIAGKLESLHPPKDKGDETSGENEGEDKP